MDWLAFLSDAALKAAVILAAAVVIELILRKRSAASRHLVWTLAAIAAIGMPILTALLPTWHVLPAAAPAQGMAIVIEAPAPVVAADLPEPALAAPVLTAEVVSDAPPAFAEPARFDWSWPTWIAVAWTAGGVVMLIPVGIGMLSLKRLGARSTTIHDEHWLNLCTDLSRRLGLNRKIVLLGSTERAMPMTWGIVRPKVLLPAEAETWPVERQRLVLMHELAHVRRRDGLAQLLGQLARAAYWFNPLCWVAVRRMAQLRERACDDIVLNLGIKASDYAEELLTVATGYRALAGGIAMARTTKLETRLRAILDGRIDRRNLTQRAVLFVALALASLAIPLATMGTRATAQDAGPAPAAATPGATESISPAPAAPAEPTAPVTPAPAQTPDIAVAPPVINAPGADKPVNNDEVARLQAEIVKDQTLLNRYKAAKAPQLTDTQQKEMDAVMRRAELQMQQAQVQIIAAQKAAELKDRMNSRADAFKARVATQPSILFNGKPADSAILRDQLDKVEWALADRNALNAKTVYNSRALHPSASDNWTATLENDVTVQLIGVSEHPSKNRPWWKPDGSPLTDAPYDDFGRKLELGNEPMGREFAIRLANPKNVPVDLSWSLQPAGAQTITGQLTKNGQPVTDIRAAATTLAADGSTTTLLLGVASGQWRMSGEHNHLDLPEGMKNPWGAGDVLFAPANETKNGLEETVSYSLSDGDVRLVAIGADGKEMKSSWSSSSGQGAIGMVTARFNSFYIANVAKFVLQTRPYQWVEFDRVALWGKQ